MQTKKRTRNSHSKVRTGCHTCKARRVKCDEQQPSCQKCLNTGRKCEGYKTYHEWVVVVAPPRPRISDGFEDDQSRRHFDYFRNQAVHRLSRFFDANRWGKLVLQEAHASPAVRHAVIALSCSHQDYVDIGTWAVRESHYTYTAQQYSKAIKLLIKETTSNTQESRLKTLVCGLLFISIETLRGSHSAALHHLDGCLKIVKEAREQLGMASLKQDYLESTAHLLREFIPMFARLDREASLVLGRSPDQTPRKPILWDEASDSSTDGFPRHGFQSVLEALERLFWLGNSVNGILGWSPPHANQVISSESYMERVSLYQELMKWEQSVLQLLLLPVDTSDYNKLLLLRIHQRTIISLLGSSFATTERYMDTYDWAFTDILTFVSEILDHHRHARSLVTAGSNNNNDQNPSTTSKPPAPPRPSSNFSATPDPGPHFVLDCGILFSLYWTALKCRDGRLRRHAIFLLESTARGNHPLNLCHAAVAKRTVEIEEGGAAYEQEPAYGLFKRAEDIPEGHRVHNVNTEILGEENRVRVVFWCRRDGWDEGEWCENVEWVSW